MRDLKKMNSLKRKILAPVVAGSGESGYSTSVDLSGASKADSTLKNIKNSM